ncbi:MAG: type II toxin-antitoxin system PemK/MazF family toxin [Limnothrix sp.]
MPNGILDYRRGEIWWVDLNPAVGSETKKQRPCLIIQNDLGNEKSGTTIIAPLLKGNKNYPFVVNVKATAQNKLDQDRYIDLGQIRAIDSSRVKNRLGILEDTYWENIKIAVDIQLGFNVMF